MSFDVPLIASSQTPVGEDWTTALRKALARHGISDREEGITATVSDGGQADIYAGDQSVMFAVYGGFTAGVVHLVYEVASALRMFIIPAGDEEMAYRTSGNEGKSAGRLLQPGERERRRRPSRRDASPGWN